MTLMLLSRKIYFYRKQVVEASFRGPLWLLLGYKKETEKNEITHREERKYRGLSNLHPNGTPGEVVNKPNKNRQLTNS